MENTNHPTPQTILAYKKVKIEHEGVHLEILKLGKFLENPKYISKEMEEAMNSQLKHMVDYRQSLSIRLEIFEKENPYLLTEKYLDTIGEKTIGNFNPNDRNDVAEIKNRAKQFINAVDALGINDRRKAIAFTKIEEAQMFAVKSIFH